MGVDLVGFMTGYTFWFWISKQILPILANGYNLFFCVHFLEDHHNQLQTEKSKMYLFFNVTQDVWILCTNCNSNEVHEHEKYFEN